MSTFSAILSSIGSQSQAAPTPPTNRQPPTAQKASSLSTSKPLTPANMAAGVKRKPDDLESVPKQKTARVEQAGPTRPIASASISRFQLSAKSGASQQSAAAAHRTAVNRPAQGVQHAQHAQKLVSKPTSKPIESTPSASNAPAPKRGFASIMEKARAAQEAAKSVGPGMIKHKTAERLTKRERLRLKEEEKARQKAAKRGKITREDRSRSGTPATGTQKIGQELSYKGTMRKAPEPLSYTGTMRPRGQAKKKQSVHAQDKYGGYASWSDLDDAEDDEEDYDSEGSSDMEGGFDDLEREEMSALHAARKEDLDAQEEEDRHQREKLERKRKLMELSKNAAAKKKY